MSGLCGWFSHEPGALPIGQMAAPLWRLDQVPLRCGEHGAGALALAAGPDSGSLIHEDGLLIAMWGERGATLARLWRSHGPKACAAFSGSFAFAILDERRDEALLAVDRSAGRPLFYQLIGRTLVFASSAEALVQHPGSGRELDPQALYNYLYFHTVPGSSSIYRGPRRLLPGEYLHLQGGRLERARYWKMQFHEAQTLAGPDLKNEFTDTVRTAVLGALGQHQAGALLGGGPASAAIAAMLGESGTGPVQTYAVGFDVAADDTLARARQVARHFKTEHHERCLGAAEVADAVVRIAAGFDQPFGDPGVVAAFYVAELARGGGVRRLFGSHGAAELFGGKQHYAHQARFSRYESLSPALRQTLIEPLLFQLVRGIDAKMLRGARGYIRQALLPLPERLAAGNLLQGYGAEQMLEPAFLATVDPTAPAGALSQSWWLADGSSEINQMIALDMQYALADRELPKLMKGCELAGIEAVFPFLNDAVVAFAARLAPQQKLDRTELRPFFREALRASVPRKFGARRAPARLPFGHWLQTDARLRSLAFDSLSDLKQRRIVRADFIDDLLARRVAEHPAHHGSMVWLLMMLEQWLAQHKPGTAPSTLFARSRHESETCR